MRSIAFVTVCLIGVLLSSRPIYSQTPPKTRHSQSPAIQVSREIRASKLPSIKVPRVPALPRTAGTYSRHKN